jgi:Na+/citrate or Na+/malate symporter
MIVVLLKIAAFLVAWWLGAYAIERALGGPS